MGRGSILEGAFLNSAGIKGAMPEPGGGIKFWYFQPNLESVWWLIIHQELSLGQGEPGFRTNEPIIRIMGLPRTDPLPPCLPPASCLQKKFSMLGLP